MNRARSGILALFLLLPPATAGAGQIQGLSVQPSGKVYPGQKVKVTVSGSNPRCQNGVTVRFGAGAQPQIDTKSQNFPLVFETEYSTAGSKIIRAFPNPQQPSGCSSVSPPPSLTLEVSKPMAGKLTTQGVGPGPKAGDKTLQGSAPGPQADKKTFPGSGPGPAAEEKSFQGSQQAPMAEKRTIQGKRPSLQEGLKAQQTTVGLDKVTPPHIGGVTAIHLGGSAGTDPHSLTPGSLVVISGEGFGDEQGIVAVRGDFEGKKQIFLTHLEWESSKKVRGKVPPDTKAPLMEPIDVKLRVITKAMQESNEHPTTLETPGKIVHVDGDAEIVKLQKCSTGGDSDSCWSGLENSTKIDLCVGHGKVIKDAAQQIRAVIPRYQQSNWKTHTFRASHENCTGQVNNDSGHDEWLVDLRTSSTYEDCTIFDVDTALARTSEKETASFSGAGARGEKYMKAAISWEATPAGSLQYVYDVWLLCPN